MKEFKTHKDVPAKYKWDLSFLLGGKTPEALIEQLKVIKEKELKTKDSKYDSSKAYLASIKQGEKDSEFMNRLYNYISNTTSLNVIDPVSNGLMQKVEFVMYEAGNKMGPEAPRFFAHAKELKEWVKLDEFKEYAHSINNALETEKYQLPKAIQEFRMKESRADIDAMEPFSILTNAELDYGFAESTDGEKIKITPANRIELSKHKDAKVRKTASVNYINAYVKHKGTLANLLFQHKKSESTFGLIRGHKSAVDSLIFGDRVSTNMLETLYSSVQKNKNGVKKFRDAHKKFYELKFNEKMTKYDRSVELVSVAANIPVDQAIQDVSDALEPFGKEYHDVVTNAFKTNWVDFMPVKNKRSGAYSIGGTYGIDKKIICMNYNETIDSVSTLAHEMGHSMHSFFSDKYNNATNSAYPIFLAEIASIFNELMYYDHLMNTTDDKMLKFKVKQEMVQGFIGTVFRQVEWSNFEYDMYNLIDKGTPLGSFEAISDVYFKNLKKYTTKKNPKNEDSDMIFSVYVPHFYYGFY
ncbi:MAG: oligoendopeptidase F, partial [Mycoplasmataceae bacterium]|nr:oligoendopeptidase F [Mycoplasmataceae bacterium]